MLSTIHHAFAKINLGLHVLGKRTDGYHDIESIFVEVDLCDDVLVETAPHIEMVCNPPVTDSMEDNLVYKAALALQKALGMPDMGAKITVTKRIPTGAGLGGGSSDAAATLQALYELWTQRPSSTPEAIATLLPIAARLGSDVPFFLHGGMAYVTGKGEVVAPLPNTAPWWVLLVLPGIHIATSTAYSTLGITESRAPKNFDERVAQVIDNYDTLREYFTNDFELPISRQHPELSTISSRLVASGASYASMSGSGSTMFGLFTSVEKAEQAQNAFRGMVTYICRPVQRV